MVGLSELSWENQRQIQENVQQMHKLEQQEQDQQIRNSSKGPATKIKKRQSSLVEFMDR
jgi:hypothetical protein